MSVRLLLIRHGRSTWNAAGRVQGIADPPLDDLGIEQANRIAERLKDQPIAAIYSSPLQRARLTAEIIGQKFPVLPVAIDDRLKEIDVGVMTGLVWDEIAAQHPEFASRWHEEGWAAAIEGGETQAAFRARVTAAMQVIVDQHADQSVAVVAHGGTINAYLSTRLNLSLTRRSPFHFGNTSLSVVEINQRSFEIVTLNDAHHLAGMNDVVLI
jgi:probable phosphoglycerate mutase